MRSPRLLILAALAATAAAALAGMAFAAPDRQGTLGPGKLTFEWTGLDGPGVNPEFDSETGEPCDSADPTAMCDQTLLLVDVADGTGVKLAVDVVVGTDDLDVAIYESDATGKTGALKDSDGAPPGTDEHVEVANAKGHYLVKVAYFAAPLGGYSGTATVTGVPDVAPTPEPTATATPAPTPEPTPPPPAQPAPAPAQTVTPAPAVPGLVVHMKPIRERGSRIRRRGVGVRLGCSETCEAVLSARVDARTARRLGLRRRRQIGAAAVTASPGVTRTYRLELSAAARRALRRHPGTRISVVAVVTDTAGARRQRIVRRLRVS